MKINFRMASAFLLITASLSPCSPAHAELSKEDMEVVGGYPYFVALNTRCGEPSKERADSLAEYKKLFFISARSAFEFSRKMPQLTDKDKAQIELGEQKIAQFEKDGPDEESLMKANRIFVQLNADEIKSLCKTFSKDVDQRLELVKLLLNASKEMQKLMDQQNNK